MSRAEEIMLIAEELAGQNWQGVGRDRTREQVKLLTRKFKPEEVWDIIHRASLIAEAQYQRLEELLLSETTEGLD